MLTPIDYALLKACMLLRWHLKIGDPGFWSWFTVGCYIGCAVLALWVVIKQRGGSARAQVLWTLIFCAMTFLALNKQLDVQSLLTAAGRCLSKQQEWYDDRRSFQRSLVIGIVVVCVMVITCGAFWLRRDLKRNGLALCGLIFVGSYGASRAARFHHFDPLITVRVNDVVFNVIFELTGFVMVSLNALILVLSKGSRRW
ncbi:MAG: hypothetical protein ACK4HW_02405 [Roseinatronobacter sp.]